MVAKFVVQISVWVQSVTDGVNNVRAIVWVEIETCEFGLMGFS